MRLSRSASGRRHRQPGARSPRRACGSPPASDAGHRADAAVRSMLFYHDHPDTSGSEAALDLHGACRTLRRSLPPNRITAGTVRHGVRQFSMPSVMSPLIGVDHLTLDLWPAGSLPFAPDGSLITRHPFAMGVAGAQRHHGAVGRRRKPIPQAAKQPESPTKRNQFLCIYPLPMDQKCRNG